MTIFERDDELPFFKQADQIGNASLLYRKYGVEAQLSLSFQGPDLRDIGTSGDTDNYTDWDTPLDAKVSVPLGRYLRLFVEGRNLNDEPRINYAGDRNRRTAHEIYSRDVYADIDWRL